MTNVYKATGLSRPSPIREPNTFDARASGMLID
jgi:hypothetical protein